MGCSEKRVEELETMVGSATGHHDKERRQRKKAIIGFFSISLGVTLLLLKSWILEYIVASVLILKPNSEIIDFWMKAPALVPTNIYFFNWTNPDDFLNFNTKPKFQVVGPYRYLQHMEKKNVVWNKNNTVTFNQARYFYSDNEHPGGNLSDRITTINPVGVFLLDTVRDWTYFMKRGISAFLTASSYEWKITKTADQLSGSGYEDPVLNIGQYLPFLGSNIPPYKKIGILYFRNASETFDGTFNMRNGVDGKFDLLNWNYENITSRLAASCAKVKGSVGELYSRTEAKNYIEIFVPDVCRPIRFDFEKEVTVDGMRGHKYTLGKRGLDNGTLNPENKCYCVGICIPSGVINASSCHHGLPVYASLPHFSQADPVYLNAVEGLNPNVSQHEAYIVLEPNVNIVLEARVRYQVSMFAYPVEGISLFEGVPKIVFPIIWIEQIYTLPAPIRWYLKIYFMTTNAFVGVSVTLLCTGLFLLAFSEFRSKLIMLYKTRVSNKKPDSPIKPEEVPLEQNIL